MEMPDLSVLNKFKRVKGDLGYRLGSRLAKQAIKGYCVKFKYSDNYPEIKEALENTIKHIDDRDRDKFNYWWAKLHFLTRIKSDETNPELKKLRKKQARAKKRLQKEIDKKQKEMKNESNK